MIADATAEPGADRPGAAVLAFESDRYNRVSRRSARFASFPMLLFWILAAVLLAGALGALLVPLLSTRRGRGGGDAAGAAIAVLRDQRRALDAEHASGAISSGERELAIADLARRAGEEGAATIPAAAATAPPRAWPLAVALLVAVPVFAIVLYGRVGDPGAAIVDSTSAGAGALSASQIDAMIDSLARRLEQHPDDVDGWLLLARSNYALDRFTAAAAAYAKANALSGDNADLLADYADALAMAQGRSLEGQPLSLIERSLAIDPHQKKALALAATAALEAHDLDRSLALWRRLAAELAPASDEARAVAGVIAHVEAAKTHPAADANAPTTPDRAAASGTVPAGAISGRIALAAVLASKVAATDSVFVFARAVGGPRMPLAVERLSAGALPADFRLDDSMSMAPGAKLSGAKAVVVEARVSKSGNAIPQPGDLFGRSEAVSPGTAGVTITIDQVVP